MDPEAFATVAGQIVKGGTAAHCRTAVGRAYYFVFNTADLLLKDDIHFPKTADKHTKVRHYLANCGNALLQRVATSWAISILFLIVRLPPHLRSTI